MKNILSIFSKYKNFCCPVIWLVILIAIVFTFPQPFLYVGKIVEIFLSFFDKHSTGITALSAFLAVIFGAFGLDAWKKKLKGKTDYDIARQYLKAILKLRDALKFVRNSFIPAGEMQTALEKNGFSADQYEDKEKVNRAVYSLRWNKVQETWTSLEAILLEAEISWGAQAVNIQKDLDGLVRKLRSVIWLFINYPEGFRKKDKENNMLLYGTYDASDEFSNNVDKEIEKIRNFLKQYL